MIEAILRRSEGRMYRGYARVFVRRSEDVDDDFTKELSFIHDLVITDESIVYEDSFGQSHVTEVRSDCLFSLRQISKQERDFFYREGVVNAIDYRIVFYMKSISGNAILVREYKNQYVNPMLKQSGRPQYQIQLSSLFTPEEANAHFEIIEPVIAPVFLNPVPDYGIPAGDSVDVRVRIQTGARLEMDVIREDIGTPIYVWNELSDSSGWVDSVSGFREKVFTFTPLEEGYRYVFRAKSIYFNQTSSESTLRVLSMLRLGDIVSPPTPVNGSEVVNVNGLTIRVKRKSLSALGVRFFRKRVGDDSPMSSYVPYIFNSSDGEYYATYTQVLYNSSESDSANVDNLQLNEIWYKDENLVSYSVLSDKLQYTVSELEPGVSFPGNSPLSRVVLVRGGESVVIQGLLSRNPNVPYRLVNSLVSVSGVSHSITPVETNDNEVNLSLSANFLADTGDNNVQFFTKTRYNHITGKQGSEYVYIKVEDPVPLVEVASDLVWDGEYSDYYTNTITATDHRAGQIRNRGSLGGDFAQNTSNLQFNVRTAQVQVGNRRLFRNGNIVDFQAQRHELTLSSPIPEGVFTAIYAGRHQRVSGYINRWSPVDFGSGVMFCTNNEFTVEGSIISRDVRTFTDGQNGCSVNFQPASASSPSNINSVNLNENDNFYVAIAVVTMQNSIYVIRLGRSSSWQFNQRLGALQIYRGNFLGTADARAFALNKAKHIGNFFGMNTENWSI